jgi:hypothetical protein
MRRVEFHAVKHQSTSLSDYLPDCEEAGNVLIQQVLSLNFMPFASCLPFVRSTTADTRSYSKNDTTPKLLIYLH